jgi:hypothetical protein
VVLQQPNPIIVNVIEQPVESTTISDVIVGALGLTGALVLAALVLGILLGGILIGVKVLRARFNLEPPSDAESLRVTPGVGRRRRPTCGGSQKLEAGSQSETDRDRSNF